MKNFLSLLSAITFVVMFAASSIGHAKPYIDIDAMAEFEPQSDEITLVMNFKNEGDQTAEIDGLSIFFLNVFDGNGNVIFASKMLHTNDEYFPKFKLEPGHVAENVRITFSHASKSYCGDMIEHPQNYSRYSYPIDWDWEVRFY